MIIEMGSYQSRLVVGGHIKDSMHMLNERGWESGVISLQCSKEFCDSTISFFFIPSIQSHSFSFWYSLHICTYPDILMM